MSWLEKAVQAIEAQQKKVEERSPSGWWGSS